MSLFRKIIDRIRNRRKKQSVLSDEPVFDKDSSVDIPQWSVLSSVSPDNIDKEVLKVSYTNEISMPNIVHCNAVFENKSEYKLVAPWLGLGRMLQKANLTDFQINRVPKNSMES